MPSLSCPALMLATALAASSAVAAPAAPATCTTVARDAPPRVVELYTSEGCSSCPPADRWLSGLRGRADVLSAAFHVDYWDRLGWRDRFASPLHTARQAAVQSRTGARFSYTPQVLVDGRDWQRWPQLPPAQAPSGVQLTLSRLGDQVRVSVAHQGQPAQRLALWWALLEDGHDSQVRAGENAGVQLRHDHVVRRYGQWPAWSAGATAPSATLDLPARGEGGRAARLLAVVLDADSGRTLQAAQLGPCPPAAPAS